MSDSDFRARFLSRAGRAAVTVSGAELNQLQAYYELLKHWNKRINLTALPLDSLPDDTLDRLLIEPLLAVPYVENLPYRWFDIGSGGGSPAFPLKIARPRTHLTMVESRSRKAAFLREVVRELQLADTTVLGERFERVSNDPKAHHAAQLVTARAVRADGPMLDAVCRVLAPGGRLLHFGARTLRLPVDSPVELVESMSLRADGTSQLLLLRCVPRGTTAENN